MAQLPCIGLGRKYIEDSLVCSQGLHPGDEPSVLLRMMMLMMKKLMP